MQATFPEAVEEFIKEYCSNEERGAMVRQSCEQVCEYMEREANAIRRVDAYSERWHLELYHLGLVFVLTPLRLFLDIFGNDKNTHVQLVARALTLNPRQHDALRIMRTAAKIFKSHQVHDPELPIRAAQKIMDDPRVHAAARAWVNSYINRTFEATVEEWRYLVDGGVLAF